MTDKLSERINERYIDPPSNIIWAWITEDEHKEIAALEQRVEGIDKALEEIADLVDPDEPHDLGGPHISIPWILDRFAAIEEEKNDQLSETAN